MDQLKRDGIELSKRGTFQYSTFEGDERDWKDALEAYGDYDAADDAFANPDVERTGIGFDSLRVNENSMHPERPDVPLGFFGVSPVADLGVTPDVRMSPAEFNKRTHDQIKIVQDSVASHNRVMNMYNSRLKQGFR